MNQWVPFPPEELPKWAASAGATAAMSAVAFRGTVLLLWGLAAWNAFACRGLFWDGASFLANMLETRKLP